MSQPQAKVLSGAGMIAKPVLVQTAMTKAEAETDQRTLLFFLFDASPSMKDIYQMLIDEVNGFMLPALKEGASEIVGGLRIGAMAFSDRVWPLFDGKIYPIEDLPPLTMQDYVTVPNQKRWIGGTCLHAGQIEMINTARVTADDVQNNPNSGTGTPPRVLLVGLTDGKNNIAPMSRADVLKESQLCDSELYTLALAAFDTEGQVGQSDADRQAFWTQFGKETGWNDIFYVNGAGTLEERKRAFRHMLHVITSSSLAGSKTKTTQGTGNFWQTSTKPV